MTADAPAPETPYRLRCRDRVLDARPHRAAGPLVMGVLNVTPDSFFDGGRHEGPGAALYHAERLLEEGADVLDVGGESTRPRGRAYGSGAEPVDADDERRRVVPVIAAIAARFPGAVISVDTYKPAVARAALEAGAHLVNDVTAARYETGALEACAASGAAYVAMHSVGRPGEQPHEPESKRADVVTRVVEGLREAVGRAEAAGVGSIVLDPGIGFGKTTGENLALIACPEALLALGRPVLVGLSRKAVVGHVLGAEEAPVPAERRLFGSVGGAVAAVLGGASLVRVHDVRATKEAVRFAAAVRAAGLGAAAEAREIGAWARHQQPAARQQAARQPAAQHPAPR